MTEEEIAKLLHPNIEYIENDRIGKVICKGLAQLVKLRPSDPIDHLGKWLLTHQSHLNITRTVTDFLPYR